jgi:hypothetical protein
VEDADNKFFQSSCGGKKRIVNDLLVQRQKMTIK